MFHRYDKHCFGIPLWKSKHIFIELWIVSSNYKIKEHSHSNENIELMYIFGKTIFFRRHPLTLSVDYFRPKWYNIFRCCTIPAGYFHWFETSKWPLVFINFSRFLNNVLPVSASIDIKLKE